MLVPDLKSPQTPDQIQQDILQKLNDASSGIKVNEIKTFSIPIPAVENEEDLVTEANKKTKEDQDISSPKLLLFHQSQ